jgi:hypothetical protein
MQAAVHYSTAVVKLAEQEDAGCCLHCRRTQPAHLLLQQLRGSVRRVLVYTHPVHDAIKPGSQFRHMLRERNMRFRIWRLN